MDNFEFVMMMVNEAIILKEESYHCLCVDDGYCRYLMRAEWANGAPSICIMYDDVNGGFEVYREVTDISDTDAIKALVSEWQEIEDSFKED